MQKYNDHYEGGSPKAKLKIWIRDHLLQVKRKSLDRDEKLLERDVITEACEYEVESAGKKHHLIELLQNHLIWKSMAFWEACFHDDQIESLGDAKYQNVVGKLPNFLHNMRELRIGRNTCLKFLQKQAYKAKLSLEDYTTIKVALFNM